MREILFRGKRVDNKEWVYGFYSNAKGENGRFHYIQDENSFVKVDPSTVGQYTGITDKNDKKIFEGDIVAFTFHSDLAEHARLEERPEITENHVILFHDGSFWMKRIVVPDSLTVHLYGGRIMLESLWKNRIEVIGNIHDNPDLLKGGAK